MRSQLAMANLLGLKLADLLACLRVWRLAWCLESPLLEALVEFFHLRSLGWYFFLECSALAASLLFSLMTVRVLAMAFLATLIRANLTCGADETFEVLKETSSVLNLLRVVTRAASSCFLSS